MQTERYDALIERQHRLIAKTEQLIEDYERWLAEAKERKEMHEFTLTRRGDGHKLIVWGIGATREAARQHLLTYSLAGMDLTKWELSE